MKAVVIVRRPFRGRRASFLSANSAGFGAATGFGVGRGVGLLSEGAALAPHLTLLGVEVACGVACGAALRSLAREGADAP